MHSITATRTGLWATIALCLMIGQLTAAELHFRKGSIVVESLQEAFDHASAYGRPIAVFYGADIENSLLQAWQTIPALEHYVVALITFGPQGEAGRRWRQIYDAAQAKAGTYIPRIYALDREGAYVDVIPYRTPASKADQTLKQLLKGEGVIASQRYIDGIYALLNTASTLIDDGNLRQAKRALQQLDGAIGKLSEGEYTQRYAEVLTVYGDAVYTDTEAAIAEERESDGDVESLLRRVVNNHSGLLPESWETRMQDLLAVETPEAPEVADAEEQTPDNEPEQRPSKEVAATDEADHRAADEADEEDDKPSKEVADDGGFGF